ncbi:hypothetical protein PRUB_a4404 [Pseudoalteromonas rubra]|uniref:Uncharacterized protein n=1 Tax=Pseudoalteromonas rubra TaxID=43658 RepID=A0A8T0C906_9GAMM|nr:hypothetical protein [Pseudoalteromonas rubra]KAF7787227.1 hypothetical protein PRUB_a4404 [Pseudoalteromonas rubra]
MKRKYIARMFDTAGAERVDILTLEDAFNDVHDGEFDVVLLRVEAQESVDFWWEKHAEQGIGDNTYQAGINTTGMRLGKLQKASDDEYEARSQLYFDSAKAVNFALRQTPYFTFFERELNARTLEVEQDLEMLIASRHEYPPSTEKHFSSAPHANSISYARASKFWPVKESYPQTAAFLTVQNATNCAGFTMWDYSPASLGEVDEFSALYDKDKDRALAFLGQYSSIEINPSEGDLCVFNCRKMHGIQTCNALRKTIGSFFIKEDGWRMFG